jgi:hypothetical protein
MYQQNQQEQLNQNNPQMHRDHNQQLGQPQHSVRFNVQMVKVIHTPNCLVCKCPLQEDQPLLAFGLPYMITLHENCAPFFPFSKGWPHPMPLDFYSSESVYKH